MRTDRHDSVWFSYVKALRSGKSHADSLAASGIAPEDFDRILSGSQDRHAEYEEAKTVNLRAQWSTKQLETVMNAVVSRSHGGNLEKILAKQSPKRQLADFLRLVERDPIVGAMFFEARRLQAQAMIDDLMETISKGVEKGESQSITNKTNTLKWLMARFNEDFDSAKKAQKDQVSTAELEAKLEDARKRAENVNRERAGSDSEWTDDDNFFG